MTPNIYIVRDASSAHIPKRQHDGDVGWDLYTSRDSIIDPHAAMDVHTDIRVAMPTNMWGMIVGRSSSIRNWGIRVETGIIDSGYRGELNVMAWNLTDKAVMVPEGMRIAQLILMNKVNVNWIETETLSPTERGADGFGSTGI